MGDRDTDADWARIAATEPYFGVLSDNRFLSAHLDDAAREEFFASGRDYVASALRSAAPFLAGRRIRNALDFGCGVGRLLLPIAETSEQAFGIDIAPGMRELARGNAENAHLTNVTLCASVDELPANVTFDWINSYIVFQHIPPTRGYAILENLLKRLSVGGVVSLQFSIARDRRLLEDSTNRLRLYRIDDGAMTPLLVAPDDGAARMSMFDYDLNVLLPILHQHGIENLFLHHDIVNGHYGISLTGGRVRSSQGASLGFADEARFGVGGSVAFLKSGFSSPEPWGVWTDGAKAELALPIVVDGPAILELEGTVYAPGASQTVTVLVNDELRAELNAEHGAPMRLRINIGPQDCGGGPVRVALVIAAPRSPALCGEGNDFRELGFGLRRARILRPHDAA